MSTKHTRTLFVGALAGAVATGAVIAGPALAAVGDDDPTEVTTTVSDVDGAEGRTRLAERIEAQLADLVEDGTIDAAQAQIVAEHLAAQFPTRAERQADRGERRERREEARDAVADTLGLTESEIRTALAGGTTMADLAEQQGVPLDALVDAALAPFAAHLDEQVAAGEISQDQAELRLASARDEFTERFSNPAPRHGAGDGHRGGPRGAADAMGGPDGPGN